MLVLAVNTPTAAAVMPETVNKDSIKDEQSQSVPVSDNDIHGEDTVGSIC